MIKKFLIEKYFKKANENKNLSKNKKAIKYLDRILSLDKNNVDALVCKSHCYACMYNKTEAIKCLDSVSKLLPNSNELLIQKGIIYYIIDEYETAINCFKKACNPESPDIYLLMEIGTSYLNSEKYSEALFYFKEILKLNENDSDAYSSMGLVYDFQEEHDTALKYFNIALDIDSENIIALACKADTLLGQGNFIESLECLNKIFSIRDDIIMTKITKCYVLSYLDKFDESLDGFKEIDKLDFDDYGLKRVYYSYYAKSLVNMERLDDALKVYDELSI